MIPIPQTAIHIHSWDLNILLVFGLIYLGCTLISLVIFLYSMIKD